MLLPAYTCRTLEELALCTIWEDEEGIAIVTVLKTGLHWHAPDEPGMETLSEVFLQSSLSRPPLSTRTNQYTIGILPDSTTAILMWPRLSDVFCMVPKMMRLLLYVIGPNTSSTHLQFGNASDEEDVL